ncbi:MAG: DUF4263 domain-containing protein [Nanoarchaeota archaeon]|nr:DUF4263 domain-containing protein [Nanoarchaeota archaeon]
MAEEYWLKIPYGLKEYTQANGTFYTNKFKKNTRSKADNLARRLSLLTGIGRLEPYWTTISAFGWVFCDYEPEKLGSSILGNGGKNLAELLKQEYKYIILSMFINSNIEEFDYQNKKGLIINIKFFKEFVKVFSSPAKRVQLFTYKFKSETELLIVKRWMNSRPSDLKQEDKKIFSKDILKSLNENREFFTSNSNTSRALEIIQKQSVVSQYDTMKESLNKFRKMINDIKTSEMEINKFLLENIWIISFDYANLDTKKDKDYDIHLADKKWNLGRDIVIELKKASKKTQVNYSKHKVISAEVGKAISQCINYMEEEKEMFEKGIIILGRTPTKAIKRVDKYLHNIELMTYDMIYQRARRVMDFLEGKYNLKKENFNVQENNATKNKTQTN